VPKDEKMNDVRKIGKNTFFLLMSQIIFSISALMVSIFIARILGDIAFGKYSIANAIPQILTVFLDFGYATLLIKEVSKDKTLSDKYLSNLLRFRLLLFPIILFLLLIIVSVMGYPESTKNIIYLFSIFIFLRTITNIFYATFRAFEKMEYEAAIVIFSTILRSSLAVIFLSLGYGLIEIGLIFVFSGVAEFITALIVCRKRFITKFQTNPIFIRKTIKIALPLAMLNIFGIIYVRIDTVMLSYFKGEAVVGWYNAAYNLVLGFQFIPHLFMQALLPIMSIYYLSSRESLQKIYEKSFKYLFILGLPIAVGVFILANKFIFFFYGNDFVNSVIALRILSWDILLYFLYTCTGFVLISTDKQNQMATSVIFSSILNIALNLLLIPKFSYVGSGIATIITEIILLFIYFFVNKRNSFSIDVRGILIVPSIACLFMGMFLYFFSGVQLFIQILIGTLIYLIFLILLKGLTKDDLSLFKQLIKRNL
jgi:O-antigen/teichoic acid export membrane protein